MVGVQCNVMYVHLSDGNNGRLLFVLIKSYEISCRCVIVWAKFKIVHEPGWLLTGSCVGDNDKT